jgi:ABC-type sugar transport system ATPase subunit
VMKKLMKVFPGSRNVPAKTAVKSVSLGLQYGEIFGLLGPNGAGKTTMISILSGLITRTSGVSSVGGYDTESELDFVHQVMGICPQFNLLFDELTVKDHLEFYCRLKGNYSKRTFKYLYFNPYIYIYIYDIIKVYLDLRSELVCNKPQRLYYLPVIFLPNLLTSSLVEGRGD